MSYVQNVGVRAYPLSTVLIRLSTSPLEDVDRSVYLTTSVIPIRDPMKVEVVAELVEE